MRKIRTLLLNALILKARQQGDYLRAALLRHLAQSDR